MSLRRTLKLFSAAFAGCLFLGCATYQGKVEKSREEIRAGQFDSAIDQLKLLAEKENDDQLVYLLDYGVALQLAGKYKESADAFNKADKLSEVQDYHSISRIAGSLVLNEEMVQYKGEDYEKVLINAENAVNYIMLKDPDAALVEVRRLNEKLYKYKTEAKKDLGQNFFAVYLSALIWEGNQNYDDAYIAFEDAYKIKPNFEWIGKDLIRAAKKARRDDSYKKWKKEFPNVVEDKNWYDKNFGELVVIYQQGWGPRKNFHPASHRVPKLYPSSSWTHRIKVNVDQSQTVSSYEAFDVTDQAMKTLNDQYDALIAKRVGGVVAKAVVADQIRQKNALLGDLTWIALNVADRADLRHWSTLPESFQVARLYLPAGKHKFSIQGISSYGDLTGENVSDVEVEIRPGKKTFYAWRSLK